MNLGKYNKVTVQDFYNYCKSHNTLQLEVTTAYNIFIREVTLKNSFHDNTISPAKDIAVDFFGESKEYTTEEVMELFNS